MPDYVGYLRSLGKISKEESGICTIGQLKKFLEDVPDDATIYIDQCFYESYEFSIHYNKDLNEVIAD